MKIEINVPKPEEAAEIQNVFYKTWLVTYPNQESGITIDDIHDRISKLTSTEGIESLSNHLKNPSKDKHFFIAKVDNKIVGVCILLNLEDRNHLKSIYVLPEFQGKGIGKIMWNKIREFLNPDKKTVVHVATYNIGAINFYKKLGFKDTGKRFTEERFRMKSGSIIPEMEMILRK